MAVDKKFSDFETVPSVIGSDTSVGERTSNPLGEKYIQPTQTQVATFMQSEILPFKFISDWNASTNTPALADGVGTEGNFYRVSVDGTTSLDGVAIWVADDWAWFDGTVWRKNNSSVQDFPVDSVHGRTGDVVSVLNDYAASQVNNDSTVTGATVKDALETLSSSSAGLTATGLINMTGDITINTPTTIDIPAGTGQVIDASDPDNITKTDVSFGPFTNQSLTNIGTQPLTFFSINSAGLLVQREAAIEGDLLRTEFLIGTAIHLDMANISNVVTVTAAPIFNLALTVGDLSNTLGVIQPKNNEVSVSANGANLSIDTSNGKFFSLGANWAANKDSPNLFDYIGVPVAPFFHTWRDGVGGFNVSPAPITIINPGRYDDGTGGVTEPNGLVSSVEFQNFMVFLEPAGGFILIHYGQNKYESIIGAELGRDSDRETALLNPDLADFSFVGYITCRGDAATLNDSTQSSFGISQKVNEFYDKITSLGDGLVQDKSTEILVVANGTTTTVEFQLTGGGDITVQLDGQGFNLADNGVDNLVSLTHGTDELPTKNYVYCIMSGSKSILQSSTTKPTVLGVGLYANVATYLVSSALFIQANGFLSSHQIIDKFGSDDQSHIRHVNEVLRENAEWISGVDQTMTRVPQAALVDDIFIATTSGIVRQLHKHVWSLFSNGDPIYWENNPAGSYTEITNLNEINVDTTGTTLFSNGRRYIIGVWGSQDQDGSDRKVFATSPTGFYSNDADAITDANNTVNASFPVEFKGTAFLIAKFILSYTNADNGTLNFVQVNGSDFVDLRQAGAGGGGSVITQTEFSDADFSVFNSTDPTKKVKRSAANISTGTTRTITDADRDLDLAAPIFDSVTLTNLVNEFSIDGTLAGDSDTAIPTEKSVKTYVDNHSANGLWTRTGVNLAPTNAGDTVETPDGLSVSGGTLGLASGASINEFSIDGTLSGNSDTAAPTEKAVKTYVDGLPVGSTFLDNAFEIKNAADPTKIAKESLVLIDTGTTKTYNKPNKSGTYAMLSDVSSGLVDTVGIGGKYATISAALADGSRNFSQISDVTDTVAQFIPSNENVTHHYNGFTWNKGSTQAVMSGTTIYRTTGEGKLVYTGSAGTPVFNVSSTVTLDFSGIDEFSPTNLNAPISQGGIVIVDKVRVNLLDGINNTFSGLSDNSSFTNIDLFGAGISTARFLVSAPAGVYSNIQCHGTFGFTLANAIMAWSANTGLVIDNIVSHSGAPFLSVSAQSPTISNINGFGMDLNGTLVGLYSNMNLDSLDMTDVACGGNYFTNLSVVENHIVAGNDNVFNGTNNAGDLTASGSNNKFFLSKVVGTYTDSGTNNQRSNKADFTILDVKTETGTTYFSLKTDEYNIMTNANPVAVTIDAAYIGKVINWKQGGAGQLTFSGGAGMTVNSADGVFKTRDINSPVTTVQETATTVTVIGDLSA